MVSSLDEFPKSGLAEACWTSLDFGARLLADADFKRILNIALRVLSCCASGQRMIEGVEVDILVYESKTELSRHIDGVFKSNICWFRLAYAEGHGLEISTIEIVDFGFVGSSRSGR